MTSVMVGMQDSLLVLESTNKGNKIHECLKGTNPQKIAFDPRNPDRAYCATFGDGLWKTDDGGQTWNNIGKDIISSPYVMSVSVSPLDMEISSTKYMLEPTQLHFTFQMMGVTHGKKWRH